MGRVPASQAILKRNIRGLTRTAPTDTIPRDPALRRTAFPRHGNGQQDGRTCDDGKTADVGGCYSTTYSTVVIAPHVENRELVCSFFTAVVACPSHPWTCHAQGLPRCVVSRKSRRCGYSKREGEWGVRYANTTTGLDDVPNNMNSVACCISPTTNGVVSIEVVDQCAFDPDSRSLLLSCLVPGRHLCASATLRL